MDSIYNKAELRQGEEHKIFVKTSSDRVGALQREIKTVHPYAVAEILQFKIHSGEPEYLNWITESTR